MLALLDELGSPATMGMAGPRFFGFVIGGSLPVTLAANWLATAWDQNAAFDSVTPAASLLEAVALEWLLDIFGLPEGCAGAFVTGATMANFSALAAARHAVLAGQDWDVEADGLFGAPPITVVIGEEAHPTLIKALGLVGFGRNRVVRVPGRRPGPHARRRAAAAHGRDDRLRAGRQRQHRRVRPARRRSRERAREAGAWVHVDGAFGLWAAAAPARAHLVAGLRPRRLLGDRRATSGSTCPTTAASRSCATPRRCAPRWPSPPTTCRPPSGVRNPSDYTPELSRRARGVEVWAALRSLGRSGLAD